MKTMTVLEKRLKRAHDYRQSAFKQEKTAQVIPLWNQVEGQYVPVRSDGRLPRNEQMKMNGTDPFAKKKDHWYVPVWQYIRVRHVMFAMALAAILLIILCSHTP